jgi:transcriptional regulator with XRE-family HTH domain
MNRSKRLAEAREAAGYSQAEFAKKVGVSPGTVGGWETGAHGIRTKHLDKIAEVLGRDVARSLVA